MNDPNYTTLSKLIQVLKELTEDSRNETQNKFILEIEKEDFDAEILNELLKIDELYTNTNVEKPFTLEPLLKTKWKEIKGQKINPQKVIPPQGPENFLYYTTKLNKDTFEFEIFLKKLEKPVPPDVFDFIHEAESVQRTIKALFSNEEILEQLEVLEGIVEVGGTSTYLALAKAQLIQLKQEIVLRKGNLIKSNYLTTYGWYALKSIGICFTSVLFLLIISENSLPLISKPLTLNALFLLIGTAIGAWLIFAIKKREVSFEDLRILNENSKLALFRLLVIQLIALVFYFMFITEFLNFKIGNVFDTANLKSENYKNIAFIIGVFIGLSESTIGATLTTKVEAFIAKL